MAGPTGNPRPRGACGVFPVDRWVYPGQVPGPSLKGRSASQESSRDMSEVPCPQSGKARPVHNRIPAPGSPRLQFCSCPTSMDQCVFKPPRLVSLAIWSSVKSRCPQTRRDIKAAANGLSSSLANPSPGIGSLSWQPALCWLLQGGAGRAGGIGARSLAEHIFGTSVGFLVRGKGSTLTCSVHMQKDICGALGNPFGTCLST